MGTEGGDKCVDNVDKLRKKEWRKGDEPGRGLQHHGAATWQGNFELAANFGYSSRGSAPRESLRKRRISKLALSAHKVLPPPWCRRPLPGSGFCVGEGGRALRDPGHVGRGTDCGWKEEVQESTGTEQEKGSGEFLHIKMAN